MLLVKVPVPVPSLVLLLLIVGPTDVPQHTPRAVIGELASDVMFPPAVAPVVPMLLGVVVVSVGISPCRVVNVTSFPYVTPSLFVIKALT